MKLLGGNLFRSATRCAFIRQVMFFALLLAALRGSALAAPDPNMPVWKVQLFVLVSNLPNAGTDDFVSVSLNDNNLTWLNYGRNDFERNQAYTFNLRLEGITRLADIQRIFINKVGNDGLNINIIHLYVNGRLVEHMIYAENLNNRWFDSGTTDTRSYTVEGTTLVSHVKWNNYNPGPPSLTLTRAQLEHHIEGLILGCGGPHG